MKKYLITLITEKGVDIDTELIIEGHFGITYRMLIDFIEAQKEYHKQIRDTLVKIDFMNGDVFHYFDFLAKGMIKAAGY